MQDIIASVLFRLPQTSAPIGKLSLQESVKFRTLTCESREGIQDVGEVVGVQPIGVGYSLVGLPQSWPERAIFGDVPDSCLPRYARVYRGQAIDYIRWRALASVGCR